jgi:SAM-dependent methyltransferase
MQTLWDELFKQKKFRLRYPAEEVVRFLAANPAKDWGVLLGLDIGCGCGRHMNTLAEFGYTPYGIDQSQIGLDRARGFAEAYVPFIGRFIKSELIALPFEPNYFDIVLAYACLYYGTLESMQLGIAEIHRVLKPGGKAFVSLRTVMDRRYLHFRNKGISRDTIEMISNETNEMGMTMVFVDYETTNQLFCAFSDIACQFCDTSIPFDPSRVPEHIPVDSNFLITVTK